MLNPGDIFSLIGALRYSGESTDWVSSYAEGEQTVAHLHSLMERSLPSIASDGKLLSVFDRFDSSFITRSPHDVLLSLSDIYGISSEEPVKRLLHIAELHDDLVTFINTITLGNDADIVRNGRGNRAGCDAVILSSLHAAKGLEFPVTFICGVDEGLLPFINAQGESTDIDEERRLFYVGITRAREELILTTAKQRSFYGKTERCEMSRFIDEMGREYTIHETYQSEPEVRQMSLL